MYERLKIIRKHFNLSQEGFADRLGIKRSAISNYEIGRNEPIDAVVSLICREFGVSEAWLRTGVGEMFIQKSWGEQIGDIAKNAAEHDPEAAKRFFVSLLEDMTEGEIMIMYEIFKKHFPDDKQQDGR